LAKVPTEVTASTHINIIGLEVAKINTYILIFESFFYICIQNHSCKIR